MRDDDTAFNDFVEQAKAKTGLVHFELVRKRKRKQQAGETREGEVDLSGKENFRIETFITILDRLYPELIKRADAYKNIFEKFNFLYKIVDISESEILNCAKQLQNSFARFGRILSKRMSSFSVLPKNFFNFRSTNKSDCS